MSLEVAIWRVQKLPSCLLCQCACIESPISWSCTLIANTMKVILSIDLIQPGARRIDAFTHPNCLTSCPLTFYWTYIVRFCTLSTQALRQATYVPASPLAAPSCRLRVKEQRIWTRWPKPINRSISCTCNRCYKVSRSGHRVRVVQGFGVLGRVGDLGRRPKVDFR